MPSPSTSVPSRRVRQGMANTSAAACAAGRSSQATRPGSTIPASGPRRRGRAGEVVGERPLADEREVGVAGGERGPPATPRAAGPAPCAARAGTDAPDQQRLVRDAPGAPQRHEPSTSGWKRSTSTPGGMRTTRSARTWGASRSSVQSEMVVRAASPRVARRTRWPRPTVTSPASRPWESATTGTPRSRPSRGASSPSGQDAPRTTTSGRCSRATSRTRRAIAGVGRTAPGARTVRYGWRRRARAVRRPPDPPGRRRRSSSGGPGRAGCRRTAGSRRRAAAGRWSATAPSRAPPAGQRRRGGGGPALVAPRAPRGSAGEPVSAAAAAAAARSRSRRGRVGAVQQLDGPRRVGDRRGPGRRRSARSGPPRPGRRRARAPGGRPRPPRGARWR